MKNQRNIVNFVYSILFTFILLNYLKINNSLFTLINKDLPNSNFFKKNLEHVAFPSITEQDDKVEETPKYSLVNKDLNSGDVDLLATIEHIEEEHRKKGNKIVYIIFFQNLKPN